jgi:hypothetical protein
MKRMFVGMGMAALLAGPALADRLDRMADELTESGATSGTVNVTRGVFGIAGKDMVRVAGDQCAGRPIGAVSQYHDGKDVAAAIFTLGMYTPLHVTYTCAPPQRANR